MKPNRYRQAAREICQALDKRKSLSQLELARWREMTEPDEELCRIIRKSIHGMVADFRKMNEGSSDDIEPP